MSEKRIAKYNPQEIEPKWQQRWAADRLYEVGENAPGPKWYDLTMFPYTSGDLHVGHWYAMAPSDVHARFKRMQGYNVLHPIGFDAFGLPAENAAISHGIHPFVWTMQNIERMRRQLRTMGSMYDWSREVVTCLPNYYRWTQWFFLKLYQAGLAYRAKASVNWCLNCQTVLANEQVVGEGVCERCKGEVGRKDLEQWFLRITDYAERLLDYGDIDWPERIRKMQGNWIGKSDGVEVAFGVEDGVEEQDIRVFTTRADTIFGVTFVVLAPEHPLVHKLTSSQRREEVERYVEWARRQSDTERSAADRQKTGVFIGAYAVNKINGERVPFWIADYVRMSYGTGAVMAVPAHDDRDFQFAKTFGLPIRVVIAPEGWRGDELEEAYVEPGTMVNSGHFDGLPSEQGKKAVSDFIESMGYGERKTSYRLRDWLISRQRYWGAPIPIIYCDKCGIVSVPEADLPVLLPEDAEFSPTGGAEHATMHLLYARFFVKALRDLGIVDFDEPFTRLCNQGIIAIERQKMSKSRGRVITPDEYVAELGADAVRAYLMFIGPWEQGGEWDDRGIKGIARWLNRIWSLALGTYAQGKPDASEAKILCHVSHKTTKKVTGDLERFRFNTMISALMEFTNHLGKVREEQLVESAAWEDAIDTLLLLLAPTAPHIAEELWFRTGHAYSIHSQDFPVWDEELAADEEFNLVIQVNGKLRDRVRVAASLAEGEAQQLALGRERIRRHLEGGQVTRIIYVPRRLVNIVVK
ncbi:leucine--tRNA ligase [Chloroflexota bacterium]